MKLKEFDIVELLTKIDDEPVEIGDIGVVVDLLKSGAIVVEFFDDDDNTTAVVILKENEVKKVKSGTTVESKS